VLRGPLATMRPRMPQTGRRQQHDDQQREQQRVFHGGETALRPKESAKPCDDRKLVSGGMHRKRPHSAVASGHIMEADGSQSLASAKDNGPRRPRPERRLVLQLGRAEALKSNIGHTPEPGKESGRVAGAGGLLGRSAATPRRWTDRPK